MPLVITKWQLQIKWGKLSGEDWPKWQTMHSWNFNGDGSPHHYYFLQTSLSTTKTSIKVDGHLRPLIKSAHMCLQVAIPFSPRINYPQSNSVVDHKIFLERKTCKYIFFGNVKHRWNLNKIFPKHFRGSTSFHEMMMMFMFLAYYLCEMEAAGYEFHFVIMS